ncbi:hypothetical protein C1H46_030111 [Malus baccata]|uniref:Uncharacterized protein n=1 Tax=Malus baccata TaxID=106549 RepID=A0A540LD34_MALBA|nr:hypothetical protein C1H46_030111 [Malus baccata]
MNSTADFSLKLPTNKGTNQSTHTSQMKQPTNQSKAQPTAWAQNKKETRECSSSPRRSSRSRIAQIHISNHTPTSRSSHPTPSPGTQPPMKKSSSQKRNSGYLRKESLAKLRTTPPSKADQEKVVV